MRPHKRAALDLSPNVDTDSLITLDGVRNVVQEIFKKEMENMLVRFGDQIKSAVADALVPIKQEIQNLHQVVADVYERCENVNVSLTTTSNDVKELQSTNLTLQLENKKLSSRLNLLEQYARSNNVEIQCIPKKKNENLIEVVAEIGKTIGYQVPKENISNCSRIAKINPKSDRPRSVVVQFSSPRIRDTFLASVIKFNRSNASDKLNTSHIKIPGVKRPIFIMEHLSTTNKAIHAAARAAAKEKGYKYVWVRNGRVYMRKTDTSNHRFINDHECLQNLD
ncbi:uncharacterized protein [Epargyreus clarus]|uniref:uncharacterized protein n=1 Tax=Epargyreus clarus TaxID=520877 RepID=UPI003C2DAD15